MHLQYQLDMRDFVLDALRTTDRVVVVGMATGTGKTRTAYMVIRELLQDSTARVLVLPHNQLVLLDNFLKDTQGLDPYRYTGQKDLAGVKDSRFVVGIPAALSKVLNKIGKFTHVFIDEGHERYGKPEYLRIWEAVGRPREVILTASHGAFHDGVFGKTYTKRTFSMYDGFKAGRISDFTSVGIQTPWNITRDDYTDSGELRGTKQITKDLVLEAITDLIENYRHYFRVETLANRITSNWSLFPKTIIACHRTSMCSVVYERMNELSCAHRPRYTWTSSGRQ